MGALTSKPYAYIARPWELKTMDSIDLLDSFLSSLRYDYRGTQILRVLPNLNFFLNEEWITDRTRFHYDGIYRQRLVNPWVRVKMVAIYLSMYGIKFDNTVYNDLVPISLTSANEILYCVYNQINIDKGIFFNSLFGFSEGIATIQTTLNLSYKVGGRNLSSSFLNTRNFFKFNLSTLDKSEVCILVNSNLRHELPLLSSRIIHLIRKKGLEVLVFGVNANLNFKNKSLGSSTSDFYEFLIGKGISSTYLLEFQNPFIIFGSLSYLNMNLKNNFDYILKTCLSKYFSPLSSNLAVGNTRNVNLYELGLLPNFGNSKNAFGINYLVSHDNIEPRSEYSYLKESLLDMGYATDVTIYVGSHGDYSINFSDVLLPSTVLPEYGDVYLNLELKVKKPKNMIYSKGDPIRTKLSFNRIMNRLLIDTKDFDYLDEDIVYNRFFDYQDKKLVEDEDFSNSQLIKKVLYFNKNFSLNNPYVLDGTTRASRFLGLAFSEFKQKEGNFKK